MFISLNSNTVRSEDFGAAESVDQVPRDWSKVLITNQFRFNPKSDKRNYLFEYGGKEAFEITTSLYRKDHNSTDDVDWCYIAQSEFVRTCILSGMHFDYSMLRRCYTGILCHTLPLSLQPLTIPVMHDSITPHVARLGMNMLKTETMETEYRKANLLTRLKSTRVCLELNMIEIL